MDQQTSGFVIREFRSARKPSKLWLLGLVGSAGIGLLLFPAKTLATPTATWDTPWSFTLGSEIARGNASNSRGFGSIGSFGEALPGTDAVAKSESSVTSASSRGSLASTSVDFERSFDLQGSPNGWSVSLFGTLDGTLSAANRSLNPRARVTASAALSGGDSISFARTINANRTDPENISFSISKIDKAFLGNGDYEVRGSLITRAAVGPSFFSSGSALSDFFNSFSVGVDAKPVTVSPVPETINPVGVLAAVGLCGCIWLRRRRALRYN